MSFTYCKSCGYKNTYAIQPPNFCSSCGEPLGGISRAMPQVNNKPSRRTIDDEDGEDPSCSDSCGPLHCTSVDDHLNYLNISLGTDGDC